MARERELGTVSGVTGRRAPVGGDGGFDSAIRRDLPQGGHRGKGAVAAGGGEDDFLAVRGPADYVIGSAVERELPRLAAGGRDDVHIVVAVAVGREGDRGAIGRESRKLVARLVIGETQDVGAVLIGDPDVAQVAERNLAFGIGGMAQQLYLRLHQDGQQEYSGRQESFSHRS